MSDQSSSSVLVLLTDFPDNFETGAWLALYTRIALLELLDRGPLIKGSVVSLKSM